MRTSDGGQTWSEYKVDNLRGLMMQVYFLNPQTGYVVCLSDKILKTEDGGLTWNLITTSFNQGYYSVSGTLNAIYVSGQGKIIKSTNGGASWTMLPNSPSDIFAVHFFDDKNGIVFGRGNYSGGDFGYAFGSIYCTNDGGDTWNGSAEIKQTRLIGSISFPLNNIGYALGGGNKIIRLH